MAMNAPQVVVASGAGRAQLVLAGGLLLIGANLLLEPTARTILANVFHAPAAAKSLDHGATSTGLLDLGVQLLVVLALYVVASVSDAAGALAVAILAAMWLVFLIRHADLLTALGVHS